jgi:pyridoxine/pyridoxamine 5'-phosphate oxidase
MIYLQRGRSRREATHPFGTISTVSAASLPAAAAVYLWAKSDLTLYFSTRIHSEKFENISHNAMVAVTIADEVTLETIQMRGVARVITDANEVRDAMAYFHSVAGKAQTKWKAHSQVISRDALKADISRWVPPVAQMQGTMQAYVKITPDWLRYRRYDADWKSGKKFTEYIIQR